MKFLRFSIFALAIIGLAGLYSCGGSDDPSPTLQGTWVLTSATEDGAAITISGSPTYTLTGNTSGSFTASGFTGDLVTITNSTSGTFEAASTNSLITFTSTDGTVTKQATITSSPLLNNDVNANWVVRFEADLNSHGNDYKDGVTFIYTFELQ